MFSEVVSPVYFGWKVADFIVLVPQVKNLTGFGREALYVDYSSGGQKVFHLSF
jgi:hypothetical protein